MLIDQRSLRRQSHRQCITQNRLNLRHGTQQRIGGNALSAALLLLLQAANLCTQRWRNALAFANTQQSQKLLAFLLILESGDGLCVLVGKVGELLCCVESRRNRTNIQNQGGNQLPTSHRLLIGCQTVPLLRITQSQTRRTLRQRIHHTVRQQILVHLRIGRNRQLHRTAPRTNRHQHIGGGGRRQQPNRMRRRLLNRLQQHIGGTLRHALGVLNQNHAPATHGRAVLSLHDQLARLINADVRRLGTKVRKICVRTVHDGHAALALAASAVLRVGLLA